MRGRKRAVASRRVSFHCCSFRLMQPDGREGPSSAPSPGHTLRSPEEWDCRGHGEAKIGWGTGRRNPLEPASRAGWISAVVRSGKEGVVWLSDVRGPGAATHPALRGQELSAGSMSPRTALLPPAPPLAGQSHQAPGWRGSSGSPGEARGDSCPHG